MSAALQLTAVCGAGSAQLGWPTNAKTWEQPQTEVEQAEVEREQGAPVADRTGELADPSEIQLAFLRRHSESLLRRYLYASIQIGRSPSLLGDPVGRGWASSRPIRTFEDAVIFVLDVEKCLARLNSLDRALLSRIVLQEYTHAEAATLLGMSARSISYKFPIALDRLTERLLESGLLVVP